MLQLGKLIGFCHWKFKLWTYLGNNQSHCRLELAELQVDNDPLVSKWVIPLNRHIMCHFIVLGLLKVFNFLFCILMVFCVTFDWCVFIQFRWSKILSIFSSSLIYAVPSYYYYVVWSFLWNIQCLIYAKTMKTQRKATRWGRIWRIEEIRQSVPTFWS